MLVRFKIIKPIVNTTGFPLLTSTIVEGCFKLIINNQECKQDKN